MNMLIIGDEMDMRTSRLYLRTGGTFWAPGVERAGRGGGRGGLSHISSIL